MIVGVYVKAMLADPANGQRARQNMVAQNSLVKERRGRWQTIWGRLARPATLPPVARRDRISPSLLPLCWPFRCRVCRVCQVCQVCLAGDSISRLPLSNARPLGRLVVARLCHPLLALLLFHARTYTRDSWARRSPARISPACPLRPSPLSPPLRRASHAEASSVSLSLEIFAKWSPNAPCPRGKTLCWSPLRPPPVRIRSASPSSRHRTTPKLIPSHSRYPH